METGAHRQCITLRRRIDGHTLALRKAVEAGNAATRADLEATLDQLWVKARTLQASARAQAAAGQCSGTRSRQSENDFADATKTGDTEASEWQYLERAAAAGGQRVQHNALLINMK